MFGFPRDVKLKIRDVYDTKQNNYVFISLCERNAFSFSRIPYGFLRLSGLYTLSLRSISFYER